MNRDEIKIDPNVLRLVMSFIQNYTSKQQNLINEYVSKMKKLSYDWDDPKGYGDLIQNLDKICGNAINNLEQINAVYRKFLYDEVLDIERRLSKIS